ncbi:nucleotide exchange factor GrpE [Mucilaginibacter sp. KACC 22063]|uniref:nucleotide exchange factor GrpE n=1 Tax=Mucilaginibacter sp. KACC 22063 TaxID=3025666 RepID=UPI002366FFA6|nr:nucleotide exchange factor GrpE [Mucilaginibacter sp. KACC 22063]WDF57013.1 nucleotide exchange factor GrpE [Mucilaginibacter sp. KACC 22063]
MIFKKMLRKKKSKEASENINNVSTENKQQEEQNPLADELNVNAQGEEAVAQPEVEAQSEPALSAEERLKAELVSANDKYLRLYAEFDNFRRRTNKERAEERLSAGKDTIAALLPVLDDFERALKAMETATDVVPVKEGVALIQNKLKHILSSKGLKEMNSKGEVFDADIHEAITNIPAPTDDLKGKVVDELEKGYFLNDKVIRFAKVVVGA